MTQTDFDFIFKIHTDTINRNEKALKILEIEEAEEGFGFVPSKKFILVFQQEHGSLIHVSSIENDKVCFDKVGEGNDRQRFTYTEAVDYAKIIKNSDNEHPIPMLNAEYRTLAIADCKDTIETYNKALKKLSTATII